MAAFDYYMGQSATPGSPPIHMANVTPNDAADLPFVTTALQVGVSGSIVATVQGGETVTIPATIVAGGGAYVLGRFTRVLATGTTATDILAVC